MANESSIQKLKAPANGITVRMYRPGHGDCFLLALPREDGDDPFYILIDCGLKPGSQKFIHKKNIGEIVKHIGASTGHHLDLVIITHEHQDHVNGFSKTRFKNFTIEKSWLAWTEDPLDEDANKLRERHKDQLLELLGARNQLQLAVGDENKELLDRLDSLISLEFGGLRESDSFSLNMLGAAADDPSRSLNKRAMKLVKDKARENQGVTYLSPGGAAHDVEGTAGIRAFVLGPPRNEDLLTDEDPVGKEGFPGHGPGAHDISFAAAVGHSGTGCDAPFSDRYHVTPEKAFLDSFFIDHYGKGDDGTNNKNRTPVADAAPWRRIGHDWLLAAEALALKINSGINNTSLVLAFELPKTKKILFFPGDAQRGSWISWNDNQTWQDGDQEIEAKDILGRTVLYKVGHHGSHNATLAGEINDNYPNLSWMGTSEYKDEFTAMITAVNEWAETKNNPPWHHPLPSIKAALEKKAQGRVFQTDIDEPKKPDDVPDAVWKKFADNAAFETLYFDYTILDE